MPAGRAKSARELELLDAAYAYVLGNGLAELSLRPLAAAIGSSPRVLLFLFGSKDGLVRALLARARSDELSLLERLREENEGADLAAVVVRIWEWLADPDHRPVLALWVEAYARSLGNPAGPWAGFAQQTVGDWLELLRRFQPAAERDTPAGLARRTAALALLRGAMLDLLGTGDVERSAAAVLGQARLL